MKFKVIAENGAEKELEIGNSTLKELRLFLEENKKQEDVFDIERDESYYTICNKGEIGCYVFYNDKVDRKLLSVANACKDAELMRTRALNETLDRLMWRFSMQNGGRGIDWKESQNKYCVCYDTEDKLWCIDNDHFYSRIGGIYFKDYKTAERCIEEVIEPFLAEHPDFEPNVY